MLTYICIYVYNLTVKYHKYTKLVLFNNNTSFRYLCIRDVGSFVIFILFYDKLYIVPTCAVSLIRTPLNFSLSLNTPCAGTNLFQ